MSAREWKPGDVVAGLLDGNEIVGIVRGGGKRIFYADSVTTDQVDLKYVDHLRPLVVIDPEDREQVERLWDVIMGVAGICEMQDALREFADPTPPRPEEPTGLGAVVEDTDGLRWIRCHTTPDRAWEAVDGQSSTKRYSQVAVVRVLSEGVTA